MADFPSIPLVYTDGFASLSTGLAGAATLITDYNYHQVLRLPHFTPPVYCEAAGIYLALLAILHLDLAKSVVCTDSLSVLSYLQRPVACPDFSQIIQFLNTILDENKEVTFVWCPRCFTIPARQVDGLAKSCAHLSPNDLPFHSVSFIHYLIRFKLDVKFLATMQRLLANNSIYAPLLKHIPLSSFPSASSERSYVLFLLNRPLTLESLSRRGISSTHLCPCCRENESTEHYFLHCSKHNVVRSRLISTFASLQVPFTLENVLTAGAISLGKADNTAISALAAFLDSATLPSIHQ